MSCFRHVTLSLIPEAMWAQPGEWRSGTTFAAPEAPCLTRPATKPSFFVKR